MHDAVLVFSHRDGMEPFEWVLSMLIGAGSSGKPVAKTKEKKPKYENVEEPGDAEVSDEAIVGLLKADELELGASSKDWAEAARSELKISKGGFYVRLPKLVAGGLVLVEEKQEKRRIFGREVVAKVKEYYDPETLKTNDLGTYNRLTAAK